MFLQKRFGQWHIVYNVGRKKYSLSTQTSDKKAAMRSMFAFKPPTTEPITIGSFFSQYHERLRITRAPSTAQRSEFALQAFEQYVPASRLLRTLCTLDFEAYKVARLRQKKSPNTINIELRHLKAAVRAAAKWGYLDSVPEIQQLQVPERAVPFFTLEELDNLVAAIEEDWARRFVLFAFSTGMRRNEIIYLTRQNVDLERRLAYVRNTNEFTTKSRKERIVPLNHTAYSLIRECRAGYVFVDGKGRRIDPRRITQAVRDAVDAAGLNNRLHLHSLRHSFCTILLQAGATFQEVQRLAGHSTVAVTERYNHMVSEGLHAAVERLDRPGSPASPAPHTAGPSHAECTPGRRGPASEAPSGALPATCVPARGPERDQKPPVQHP